MGNYTSGVNRVSSAVITPAGRNSRSYPITPPHLDTGLDDILKFLDFLSWRNVSLVSRRWSRRYSSRGSKISKDAASHLFGKEYSQRSTLLYENKSESLMFSKSSTSSEWTDACDFLLGYMHSNIGIGSSTSTSLALRLMSDFMFGVRNDDSSGLVCSKQMEKLCANPYLLSFTCIAIALKVEEGLYTGGGDIIPFPNDNLAYSSHRKYPVLTKRNVLDSEKMIMKVLKMTVPICHSAQFARSLHYRITALHHQGWKKELLRPPPLSPSGQTLSLVSKHAIFRFIQHASGRFTDSSGEGRAVHPSIKALCVTILSLGLNHIINLKFKESHHNRKLQNNNVSQRLSKQEKGGVFMATTPSSSSSPRPSLSSSFQYPLQSTPLSHLTPLVEQKVKERRVKEKRVLPALESLNLGVSCDSFSKANPVRVSTLKKAEKCREQLSGQNGGPSIQKKRKKSECGEKEGEKRKASGDIREKKGKLSLTKKVVKKENLKKEEKEEKNEKKYQENSLSQMKDSDFSHTAEYGAEVIAALIYWDLQDRESNERDEGVVHTDFQRPRRASYALNMIFDALVMSYENLLRLQEHIILPPSLKGAIVSTPTVVPLPSTSSSSLFPSPSVPSAPTLMPLTLPSLSSSSPSLSSANDVRIAGSASTLHLLPLATSSSSSISLSSSTSLSLSSTHHIPNSNIPDEKIHYENHPKALESKVPPIDMTPMDITSALPALKMSERGERSIRVAENDRLLAETFRIIFNADNPSNSGREGRELVSLLCNIDHADISNMRRQIFESMNNSFNRYKYSNSDDFTTSPSLFFPNYPVPSSDSIHLSTTTPSRSVTSTTAKGRVSIRRDKKLRSTTQRGQATASNGTCSLQNLDSKIVQVKTEKRKGKQQEEEKEEEEEAMRGGIRNRGRLPRRTLEL